MKLKAIFYSILIAAAFFSCSAQRRSQTSDGSPRNTEFAGSRLAAEVFNRWGRDQLEAQGKMVEVSKAVQSDRIERIHRRVSEVRNNY